MIMTNTILLGVLLMVLVSADCGTGGTATLSGDPYATPWEGSGCKTFTGSVALATDAHWGTLTMREIEEITGSFIAHDSYDLLDIYLSDLKKLGTLSLSNPAIGSYVDVGNLEELQNLEWSQLFFDIGMDWSINITKISKFVLYETFIFSLTSEGKYDSSSSFENLTTADNVRIERNPNMGVIGLPGLTEITESLVIGFNNLLNHTYFPALERAGNMALRGNGLLLPPESTARLDLPVITEVNGLFNVSGNPRMEEISLPALQKVDGAILLEDNPTLRSLEIPSLETVSGDVVIRGNNLSTLVNGFNCSDYDNIRPLVSGDFRCGDDIRSAPPTPAATASVNNLSPSDAAATAYSSSTSVVQTGAAKPMWNRDVLGFFVVGVASMLVIGSCLLL